MFMGFWHGFTQLQTNNFPVNTGDKCFRFLLFFFFAGEREKETKGFRNRNVYKEREREMKN